MQGLDGPGRPVLGYESWAEPIRNFRPTFAWSMDQSHPVLHTVGGNLSQSRAADRIISELRRRLAPEIRPNARLAQEAPVSTARRQLISLCGAMGRAAAPAAAVPQWRLR